MLDRPRNASLLRHRTMHVPRTMFAAAIDRFGGPEVITGHALPVPPLDADEVMIAVDDDMRAHLPHEFHAFPA